jgi:hypothetical protein
MKTKLSVCKYVCVLCCLVAASWLTTAGAQNKTVWVFPTGTYDATSLEKIEDYAITGTNGAFSSNDYNDAVADITGLTSRVYKFGGSVFSIPADYKAVELTIYGWPRRSGATTVKSIDVDGVVVASFDAENPSPYIFADCGNEVAPGTRTQANCSIFKINEVSAASPATTTFMIDISSETHAFCKVVLAPTSTGINEIELDQTIGDDTYYDLMGRKVINPTNGIYIYNGKKVVITQQ